MSGKVEDAAGRIWHAYEAGSEPRPPLSYPQLYSFALEFTSLGNRLQPIPKTQERFSAVSCEMQLEFSTEIRIALGADCFVKNEIFLEGPKGLRNHMFAVKEFVPCFAVNAARVGHRCLF